jgi:hypothetical protein
MTAAPTNLILAQATDGGTGQVVYELARLHRFDDPRLPLAVTVLIVVAVVAVVWRLYRRDTVELPRSLGITLAGLRLVALAGLVVFFLGIERRTTREVVHNSQVVVLVDVSQSMGLADGDSTTNPLPERPGSGVGQRRIDQVVATLADSPLVAALRKSHDVHIARFGQDIEPVMSLPKTEGEMKKAESGGRKGENATSSVEVESSPFPPPPSALPDWSAELQPVGTETRLGHALDKELRLHRGAPLAGVIVISDGAQNAGVEPAAAAAMASEAHVPIFTLGVGSTEPQRNLAIRDLAAPTRAFPGDTLAITGYLQAYGYAGRLVDVELRRRRSEDSAGASDPVASQRVTVGGDGEIMPVTFDFKPDEAGSFVYLARVAAPDDDANPRDNQREAEVDVVDRQTRVLLVASGPTRDYLFLCGQLHRDPTMKVDVLLQSAQPGISQDAEQILDSFPSTREELYRYDCIVAFDPDWIQLDAAQVDLLDSWVSEEAGGMIVVAGPIQTARWLRSTEQNKLRNLYPVVFQQRMTLLDDGQYGGEAPWPLEFERAGREARFLWLADTSEDNAAAWDSFPGVYGYYAVKGEKSGATVYARFSDPEAGLGSQRPVYMAGQFYGSGQVFYIGSGEMWRLRMVDPAYFEVLYTKLVRHVSQGRILRGSSRGSLVAERDRYQLGETVVLRARLLDAQHEPLILDSVTAQVIRPDGNTEAITLVADPGRPGMYVGQWTALEEGTYHVALSVPGSAEEPLTRYVQVHMPDLERKSAERNEPLLAALARQTGGLYYPRLELAAYGGDGLRPLADSIESRTEVKRIKGAPDPVFAQQQMRWLLAIIAGALLLEWTIRRASRLA